MSVSKSAISRICGVDVAFKNFNSGNAAMLPQRLAIFGQGNADATFPFDKVEVTNANDVAEKFGYGSPLHLAVKQLFPLTGKSASFPVTAYPVRCSENAIRATGKITVEGDAEKNASAKIYFGGVEVSFVVQKGDGVDEVLEAIKNAVNGTKDAPVVAGEVSELKELTITSKWTGKIGNEISIEMEGEIEGLTFAFEEMDGGAGDVDLDSAFLKIGNVWETCILSCFSYKETALLDKFFAFGESRWGYENKKPVLVAWGCVDGFQERTAITDERKNDFVNFLIQSTGSRELPFVIGAKGLLDDILTTANDNPPCGYKGLLTGLHTGADEVQEDYNTRNLSVQKGASTNTKEGNIARLNDIVTMYHPENEGKFPSRRYVVDLMKLMNIVYNLRLVCEADGKIGVPLCPDDDVVTNSTAIQPKQVVTELCALSDELAKFAIIADAAWTKENIEVSIDSENPKRLNVSFPCKLSGNVEVLSADLFFGFYLGGN